MLTNIIKYTINFVLEASMRTTITLDEQLVNELLKLSPAKSKTAAVTAAVREQIRREKLKRLAGLLGKIEMDEEQIKRADSLDMERVKLLDRKRGKR